MIRQTLQKLLSNLLFTLTLVLTACGGGGGSNPDDSGTGGTQPELPKWPQALAFTDFTNAQTNFVLGPSDTDPSKVDLACQTCITLYGIARSSGELGSLVSGKTYQNWPPPYNGKLFSELPIDYNNKMAVVVEDIRSGARYRHSVQKVEESAEAVTITMLKCMVFDVYQDSYSTQFGLLLPKSNKAVKVVMVQSGKPTLPVYEPNGLGAC